MPAPSDTTPANSPQPPSFEDGLTQLADIVNRLEGGGLGLTESIAAYERGVVILRGLHEELARAEERIRVLTAVDDEGRTTTEPFADAHDGTPADLPGNGGGERVGRRSAARAASPRKATRSQTLPGMDDSSAEA
jgi:exodeoxyribonuclease VII small subunit